MSHTARLIEDLGLEASDDENFFRSAEFLAAEGVTHTLAIGDVMRLPVIVREIEDVGRVDAISPYGYPGAHLLDPQAPGSEALDAQQIDWSETGLVSVFVRDRIGESRSFAGGTAPQRRADRRGRRRDSQTASGADQAQREARLGGSLRRPAPRMPPR